MNILAISRAYGEKAGGMERLSFELIDSLEKNPAVNITKVVHETKPGKSLAWTRLSSAFFAIIVIPKAIKESNKSDVIHLGDPVLSLVGWLIKKIIKKPIAVTVHGLDVRFSNPIYRLYLKTFFRNFDTYICISTFAKESLKPWHVSGAITIIPPGIKDHYYSKEASVKQNGFHLLTVGRLVKRKGHEWFIRNVLPSLPADTRYTIAGAGPEKENIETAITNTNQRQKVNLLGRVSPEKLKELFNSDTIFIQPNIAIPNDAEGFGITMLEAALCNRLVIASDIDGIPDAIHNNKNGILLPSQNPKAWIKKLTEIHQGSTENIQARQYTLDTFSWKKISQQYLSVFKNLTDTVNISDQNVASRKVLADSQEVKFPYTIEYKGLEIIVQENVFSPKHFHGWEIFNKNLPSVQAENVLEIGTGAGVTALYLAKQGAKHVLAVDISPHAVENTRENVKLNNIENVEVRQSDIFSAIEEDERFNTIYWNMPFIHAPTNYKYRSVLERGLFDPGYSLTERFLREGKKHLTSTGRILLGTGDFGDVERFKQIAKRYGYKVQLLARDESTEINPVVFELYEVKPL